MNMNIMYTKEHKQYTHAYIHYIQTHAHITSTPNTCKLSHYPNPLYFLPDLINKTF